MPKEGIGESGKVPKRRTRESGNVPKEGMGESGMYQKEGKGESRNVPGRWERRKMECAREEGQEKVKMY